RPSKGGRRDPPPARTSRARTRGPPPPRGAAVHQDRSSAVPAFATAPRLFGVCNMLRGGGQLHGDGLRHYSAVAHEEGEVLPVRRLEVADHGGPAAGRNTRGGARGPRSPWSCAGAVSAARPAS